MRRTSGQIISHIISPGGKPALRIEVEPVDIPSPGQPLLGYLPNSNAPLRTLLYPSRIHTDGFTSLEIPSNAWAVGTNVDLLGPIGNGFAPPLKSKRWVIISLASPIDSLLPLVDAALARDAAIVVHADTALPELPAQVEIAASTDNLFEWADYIAIGVSSLSLPEISTKLGVENVIPPAAEVELLIEQAMPCGLGVCSACSFHTRDGWKTACQDGPVYKAKDWLWAL